jgi:hypothetical protein
VSALEKVLDALYRVTGKPITGGGPYNAACPAHADRHRSLLVGKEEKKIWLNCHAGCPTEPYGLPRG